MLKCVLQTLRRRCFTFASTSVLSSREQLSSHNLDSITYRSFSSHKESISSTHAMEAWYINEYGSNDVLLFGRQPLPSLRRPTDILVRVHAASVNPLDYRIRSGYGETLLNVWREVENVDEFPLVLGRDFSGEVVKTGRLARRYQKGDKVSWLWMLVVSLWGVIIHLKKLLGSDWLKRSAFLVNTVQKSVTRVQITTKISEVKTKTARGQPMYFGDRRRSCETFRRFLKIARTFPKIIRILPKFSKDGRNTSEDLRQSPEISKDHWIFLKLFQVLEDKGNTFCVPQ